MRSPVPSDNLSLNTSPKIKPENHFVDTISGIRHSKCLLYTSLKFSKLKSAPVLAVPCVRHGFLLSKQAILILPHCER